MALKIVTCKSVEIKFYIIVSGFFLSNIINISLQYILLIY